MFGSNSTALLRFVAPEKKVRFRIFLSASIVLLMVFLMGVYVLYRFSFAMPLIASLNVGAIVLLLPMLWLYSYRDYHLVEDLYLQAAEDKDETRDRILAFTHSCIVRRLITNALTASMLLVALAQVAKQVLRPGA